MNRIKKINKNILSEALGLPDDLNMIIEIYTDMVMDSIKNHVSNTDPVKRKGHNNNIGEYSVLTYQFNITGSESWDYLSNSPKFNISEWRKFPTYRNKFEVKLAIYPKKLFSSQNLKPPQIEATHVFKPSVFKIKNLKTKGEVYDISKYEMTIHTDKAFLKNFEILRTKTKAVLAHELFHSYQLFIRYKSTNKVGFGKETTMNFLQQNLRSGINEEWNNFMMRIYYSLRFEQQARAPQTYYELKDKKITNYTEFIEALKDTDVWKEIEYLKSFSVEKMIQKMSSIESIEDLILQGPRSQEFIENLANWNEFLDICRKQLIDMGLHVDPFRNLSSNIIENPEKFLNYWKKIFNSRADEMFRKMTRLYDKVKTD
jgi:hypothetical protein